MWHWQYLCESCAGANSYKLPTYLLAGAMLFVLMHGVVSEHKMRARPLSGGLQCDV